MSAVPFYILGRRDFPLSVPPHHAGNDQSGTATLGHVESVYVASVKSVAVVILRKAARKGDAWYGSEGVKKPHCYKPGTKRFSWYLPKDIQLARSILGEWSKLKLPIGPF